MTAHSEEGDMNASSVTFKNLTDAEWLASKPQRTMKAIKIAEFSDIID